MLKILLFVIIELTLLLIVIDRIIRFIIENSARKNPSNYSMNIFPGQDEAPIFKTKNQKQNNVILKLFQTTFFSPNAKLLSASKKDAIKSMILDAILIIVFGSIMIWSLLAYFNPSIVAGINF